MISRTVVIIFNHMTFPMKLDILGAFVAELMPNYPTLVGFPAVLQLLKQAQEKRNLMAHSKWGTDPTTRQVLVWCGKQINNYPAWREHA